jgi:hypothetical protein
MHSHLKPFCLLPPVDTSTNEPLLKTFYDLTPNVAASLLSGQRDVDFLPSLDASESRLANEPFDRPILVAGRSGTGKTTALVARLLTHLGSGNLDSHVIVVTKSLVLLRRIRDLCWRSMRSLGPHGVAAVDAAKKLDAAGGPHSLASVPANAWPLFVTTGRLMSMLDATLDKPYATRLADGSLKHPDRVPASWSNGVAATQTSEIDFRMFQCLWTPKLYHNCLPGACAAVWREINSVIRGGVSSALDRTGVPLSLEEYLELPSRVASAFDEGGRRDCYDAYERYQSLKRNRQLFDATDGDLYVCSQIRQKPLPEHLKLEVSQ